LIYLYLYEGASETPVEGGTVSEALIGSFPHLNPLLTSNDYNDYINNILYRSLLHYDIDKKTFVSDLASCDTSNLLYIECYLENNIKWSDGSSITVDDIIATLNLIKKTNVNPNIASLLANTHIEKGDGKITFSNEKKDINFLSVFLQPILPKTVIDSLTSDMLQGSFSPTGGIYSGMYILSNISQDETVGITKITLEKNPSYFQNPAYIEKIIFRLFDDNAHFLKYKSTVNFFNDKDNIVGDSVPRLGSFFYSLPQFVGIFLNQDTLKDTALKKYILAHIDRDKIVASLGAQKVKSTLNPFFSERNIDQDSQEDISGIMKDLGYYPKKELVESKKAELAAPKQKAISQEATPAKEKIVQSDLHVISSPTNKKYNFVSEDNILLKGNVPKGVEAVYVNDYKLQGFTP